MPEFIIKFLMGEVAEEVILVNQKIIPRRLLKENYRFAYPDLKTALKDVF